jgi:hypothetical protein
VKHRFQILLFKYINLCVRYPEARGHVTHVELSTPLTAQHFINAPGGASYGLEWTPAHFDAALQEQYFNPVVQGIPGLYLTVGRQRPRRRYICFRYSYKNITLYCIAPPC